MSLPENTEVKQDVIVFLNGDSLHGKLIEITAANKVIWQYPGVDSQIIFPANQVDLVNLATETPVPEQQNVNIIHLSNGDSIPGVITSLDDKTMVFSPVGSGTLNIPRVMIREISHSVFGREIYHGPNDNDNWIEKHAGNNKSLRVENGILAIPGRKWAINNVGLPDSCRISFEILSPGNSTQLQFFFFTETGDQGYYISQAGTYFDIERRTENGGSDTLDSFELQKLNTRKLELAVMVEKKTKRIILTANGKIIKNLTDEFGPFAGKGKSIAFYNMGGTTLNLTNISVSEWDGAVPVSGDNPEDSKDHDKINFINKDKSSGILKSINKDLIEFATDFGEIKVPFDRIKNLFLANGKQHLARRNKNDIQLFSQEGGRITVNLDKMADGQICGNSENFGTGNFKKDFFNKIRFNIYQKRPENPEPESVDKGIEVEDIEIDEDAVDLEIE